MRPLCARAAHFINTVDRLFRQSDLVHFCKNEVGDLARQFRQVFENLEAVLKGIGTDFKDVVKFTTYLVHSQDIEKFMEQRAAYFPKIFGKQPYPPNTLLIVDRLVKEDFRTSW